MHTRVNVVISWLHIGSTVLHCFGWLTSPKYKVAACVGPLRLSVRRYSNKNRVAATFTSRTTPAAVFKLAPGGRNSERAARLNSERAARLRTRRASLASATDWPSYVRAPCASRTVCPCPWPTPLRPRRGWHPHRGPAPRPRLRYVIGRVEAVSVARDIRGLNLHDVYFLDAPSCLPPPVSTPAAPSGSTRVPLAREARSRTLTR